MTLAAWFHDLDPFLVRISGDFGIRWYGLAYAAGFLVAYYLTRFLARRGATLIPEQRAGDVVIVGALCGVAGGRLGYILFYQPSLLWEFRPSFPWWGALDIMHGGMASHGGFIGALAGAWITSRWILSAAPSLGRPRAFLHTLDVMALVTPPGLFLGRLANFVNGELLGKVVALPGEPAPWWAVKFPQELAGDQAPALTLSQQQALDDLLAQVAPGQPYSSAVERLLDAVHRGTPGLAARLEPLISARVPSQLVQAAAEGLVLGAALWIIARRPRKTGLLAAAFLILYGVLRIITEIWRLPDAQFAVGRPLGLSRGQWFSAAMVAAGVVLLWRVLKLAGPALGGWARRRAPAADRDTHA